MMTVTYDIYEINTPVTSISYNDSYGYYIGANNIKPIISKYIDTKEYDHIFVGYKLGELLHEEKIRTGDWIGLGGMIYEHDIGFSNIRVPNEDSTLLYKYSIYNIFPEEVFVHEFLHGLERIEQEYGNEVIELHANEKYGYEQSNVSGLKEWYKAYLQGKVTDRGLGLSKEVFKRKPIHNSNFVNTLDVTKETFNEPENLREEIQCIIEEIKNNFYNKNELKYNNLEEDSGSIRV